MEKLKLPEYDFQKRRIDGLTCVFDIFRKKYVVLTPEEEVRQRFARFLVSERGYPASLIQTECSLLVNKMHRRCDILVHKPAGTPALLVECKAPAVRITQDVFDQVARYNMTFRVEYLVVTNGIRHYCCRIDFEESGIRFLKDIPAYAAL